MSAKEVVHVVTEADRGAGKATAAGTDGKLTWRFRAENVRDVAWGASANYLWDATNAAVGDADGDGSADTTRVDAFWRPEMRTSHWDQAARYGRHSVEFLSRYLWPYPYPHMTAVDGPTSCGGMEYPMMTCIGGQWDTLNMYEVVVHEIAHMWFPMQVGSDEKRFAWMDEGFAQFNQSQAMADFFKGYDDEAENREPYLNLAIAGGEVELMRHGDRYPNYTAYGTASYYKTATVLVALRGRARQGDVREGASRSTAGGGSTSTRRRTTSSTRSRTSPGRDLSWFWRTWFFETWKLDQAIDTVAAVGRLARGGGGEPRPGADAGPPGRHPVGGRAADRRDPGQRLVHRGEADHRPHRPGAGDQDHRDRPEAGVPGHRPGERDVAEVGRSGGAAEQAGRSLGR